MSTVSPSGICGMFQSERIEKEGREGGREREKVTELKRLIHCIQ